MKRSLMQVYVKGSAEAVELYQRAFDSPLVASYKNDDGSYMHAELDIQGQIVAVSEISVESATGSTMQFCFHYGEGNEAAVISAYEFLSEGGEVIFPLGECLFSPLMGGIIDKFGVSWCLFV